MEQSANPSARVGHYTPTISMSTQHASIWLLTAAAPSDSVFSALCTNRLTYLFTYTYNASLSSSPRKLLVSRITSFSDTLKMLITALLTDLALLRRIFWGSVTSKPHNKQSEQFSLWYEWSPRFMYTVLWKIGPLRLVWRSFSES